MLVSFHETVYGAAAQERAMFTLGFDNRGFHMCGSFQFVGHVVLPTEVFSFRYARSLICGNKKFGGFRTKSSESGAGQGCNQFSVQITV
jgi:hypothetical protein